MEEVLARDGARVEKGELLFRLSNPQLRLDLVARESPVAYWALALAVGVALVTVAVAASKQAWTAMMLRPSIALGG